MAEEEGMSDFQASLLKRLNTIKTTKPPPTPQRHTPIKQLEPPTPSAGGGNPFLREIAEKRKTLGGTQRSHDGGRAGNDEGEGKFLPPTKNRKPHAPNPPHPFPKKASQPPKTAAKVGGAGRGAKQSQPNERRGSEKAPPTSGGIAELAAKLEKRQATTTEEVTTKVVPTKSQPPPPPVRQLSEENKTAQDESIYVNLQMFQDPTSTTSSQHEEPGPPVAPRNSGNRELMHGTGTGQGDGSDAPPLPKGGPPRTLSDSTQEDSSKEKTLAAIRSKITQRKQNEKKPPIADTTTPPAPPANAPKRSRSLRSTNRVNMSDSRPGSGMNSGYNSGASGDGVIVHSATRAHGSTQDLSRGGGGGGEGGAIAPMGSSSESDYSGDGRVQRVRLQEKTRRGSTSSTSSSSAVPPKLPPPNQGPPPVGYPPQNPSPIRYPPPQHQPPPEPTPSSPSPFQPPQLPPPRQGQPELPATPPQLPPPRQAQPLSPEPPTSQATPPDLPPPRRSQPHEATPPPAEQRNAVGPLQKLNKQSLLKKSLSIKKPAGAVPTTYKLFEFLSRKGHLLPLQITVKKIRDDGSSPKGGKFGRIAVNQKLNLLFLKNTKVAEIMDPITNATYAIPFNSSIRLGLIYDPDPEDELASPYMQLQLAADVMKLKNLPLILAASSTYDGGSPEKSVSDGEIVFVKGLVKGGGVSKAKQLHVVNTNGEEKCLAAKCSGTFSTDPRHTKTHLPTLFSQELPLPKYSIIYGGRDMGRHLPTSMSNSPVLLEGMRAETTVVAVAGETYGIIAADSVVFDISAQADMEVESVDLRDPDKEALKKGANHRYHSFNPANSHWVPPGEKVGTDEKTLELQRLFYHTVLENVSEGTHLHTPSNLAPVPDFFGLDSELAKQEMLAHPIPIPSDGMISMSPSIHSLADEGMQGDSGSIASGNFSSGMFPRIGGDMSGSEADEDDDMEPESIYEDVNDLCDSIDAEIVATPTPKDIPAKKASFLSFLKSRKSKGKKERDVSPKPSHASLSVPKGTKKAKSVTPEPDLIPTYSSSGSEAEEEAEEEKDEESYDEMKPREDAYLSDNYEDVAFENNPPPLPAPIDDLGVPPVPISSIKNKAALLKKGSMLSLSRKESMERGVKAPTKVEDDTALSSVQKAQAVSKYSTLPRKMKLAGGAKSATDRSNSLRKTLDGGPPSDIAEEVLKKPTEPRGGSEFTPMELNMEVTSLRSEVEELKRKMDELFNAVESLTEKNRKLEEQMKKSRKK